MSKIANDKYYTPIAVANYCWEVVWKFFGDKITEVIEPSCGNGAFYHWHNRKPDLGIDILPQLQSENVIVGDYLNQIIPYKKGRLIIGNPPFGVHLKLAREFYRKSIEIADYIAFILPIRLLNNKISLYEFDLVYSEDLGLQHYTDRDLHCCFNIYKRPENGLPNKRNRCKLKDITIIELRREKGKEPKVEKIKPNWDYAMCNWGDGCLGNVPTYIGEYAQEVYFYCNNPQHKDQMLKLLQREKVREFVKSIASKRISVAGLYQYLADNIKGVQ